MIYPLQVPRSPFGGGVVSFCAVFNCMFMITKWAYKIVIFPVLMIILFLIFLSCTWWLAIPWSPHTMQVRVIYPSAWKFWLVAWWGGGLKWNTVSSSDHRCLKHTLNKDSIPTAKHTKRRILLSSLLASILIIHKFYNFWNTKYILLVAWTTHMTKLFYDELGGLSYK